MSSDTGASVCSTAPVAAPAGADGCRGRRIPGLYDANDSGRRLPGIRAQYENAPQPKELIVLDGSAHAQFLFQTDQSARVMHEILRFLSMP